MSSFFKLTTYNGITKQQIWLTTVQDSHDIHCGCDKPYAHLLDAIFPEGHKDRKLTIEEIIKRDSQCHSGGDEEEDHGIQLGGSAAALADIKEEKQEDSGDAELAALLAAAEEAEKR